MRATLAVAGLALTAVAGPRSAETNFFPIMPWNSPPNDLKVLQRIKDCGFTMAGFVPPAALDNCRKAGLKAIVSDPRSSNYDWPHINALTARSNVLSLLKQVGRHPAVFGFYLRDEPPSDWFPHLEQVAGPFRELAPTKWPYINLFPDYAVPGQLGATNYDEYLERFIATCRPRILSYDNYSLMDDGSVRANFWSNLESVRAAARRHDLEFWNIVLAVAHFHYAEPTAAGLRLQAYATLACGGRGLSYFTYFAPPVGGYRNAAVDQFGDETATWQLLQNVNHQVLKLAPTLLQMKCDDAYHLGEVPTGGHGPGDQSLLLRMEGGNALAGDFTHADGSRYVFVVNKSLTASRVCHPEFRNKPKQLRHISPFSGQLTPFAGEYLWLSPGQGALIKPEW